MAHIEIRIGALGSQVAIILRQIECARDIEDIRDIINRV